MNQISVGSQHGFTKRLNASDIQGKTAIISSSMGFLQLALTDPEILTSSVAN